MMTVLEVIPPGGDWREAERRWIRYYLDAGYCLTNGTSGGDGVPDLAPEARARIRAAWVGRKHRPETLEKMSLGRRGRHHSDAHRQYMREIMRGRRFTPEWLGNISRALPKLITETVRNI